MVTLQRSEGYSFSEFATRSPMQADPMLNDDWQVLGEWTLPSEAGNERLALQQVAETVRGLNLSNSRLERLKTAVAEATMNGMEHGNHYQPDKPVSIQVLTKKDVLVVRITDHGGNQPIPDPEMPDLEAKLAEMQTPRGWGLFLIKNLVDDMHVTSDETHHTVELIMHLEGEKDGTQKS
jgi:anti-sigma regulatory factor (Ser/Thr protein kinase)